MIERIWRGPIEAIDRAAETMRRLDHNSHEKHENTCPKCEGTLCDHRDFPWYKYTEKWLCLDCGETFGSDVPNDREKIAHY